LQFKNSLDKLVRDLAIHGVSPFPDAADAVAAPERSRTPVAVPGLRKALTLLTLKVELGAGCIAAISAQS
jgi:hypothetical protein